MISFVWSDPEPLYSGRGGSESYTIGQVRELNERNIPARIITVGRSKNDARNFFPDIEFHNIFSVRQLASLDDTIIFVSRPHAIKTKKKSFVVLHTQPHADPLQRRIYIKAIRGKGIIVNSKYGRRLWAEYLDIPIRGINVVYPFADPAFSVVKRPKFKLRLSRIPVLYAGRLSPEKGIYTLLEALHQEQLRAKFRLTVTTAGNQKEDGKVIEQFLRHHPWVRVINATHTPGRTAKVFARYPIVIMPSDPSYWHEPFGYWHETFGMISVEAQHAGCYVVATNDGGLPETDCGGLVLFDPSNSYSLANAIQKISGASPLSPRLRQKAIKHFSRAESVNALLAILNQGDN